MSVLQKGQGQSDNRRCDPLTDDTRKDKLIHPCGSIHDTSPEMVGKRLKGDRISIKRHTAGRVDIGNKMREIAWN